MASNPFRVGLTGGIASGKSTVRRLFAAAGFETVDADELVGELYRPGGEGSEAVRRLFGERYLDDTGAVDHPALAELVFSRPAARDALEGAIHPLVRRRFAEITGAGESATSSRVVVLEATLLVEAGYAPDFDLVVSVEADDEVRIARAVARGAIEADARARLEAQGSGDRRRAVADRILTNNTTRVELETQVENLVAEIQNRAGISNISEIGDTGEEE